ncbi:hypothetical protein V7152_14825 [Neobacillus drentensis]|uniref:hypothetical protein n=1 Tax=Neobacillus drentensis TaxID=220684 RepID=UPI002FFDD119
MLTYTTRVLLPERIVNEKSNWTDRNFLFMVQNYLLRYPHYKLIRVEGSFAICERVNTIEERRKRSEQSITKR